MERYKIVGEFTDAHTGEKHLPDEVKKFSKERVEEILKVGPLIEPAPEEPAPPTKPKRKAK